MTSYCIPDIAKNLGHACAALATPARQYCTDTRSDGGCPLRTLSCAILRACGMSTGAGTGMSPNNGRARQRGAAQVQCAQLQSACSQTTGALGGAAHLELRHLRLKGHGVCRLQLVVHLQEEAQRPVVQQLSPLARHACGSSAGRRYGYLIELHGVAR